MTWTDQKVRLAAQMWRDGYTGAAIGEQIGKSRNAVIGKLHRSGKIGEAKANIARAVERDKATRKRREVRARVRAPVVAKPLPAAKPEPSGGIPLVDLTKTTCRWPLLDEAPQLFCGKHAATGQYCEHHTERAFSAGKGVRT